MTQTLCPPQPNRAFRWLLVFACLFLLAGGGWIYSLLVNGKSGSSYKLSLSRAFVSVDHIPFIVDIEVSPQLFKDGLVTRELDTNYEISHVPFVLRQRACLQLMVIAGKHVVDSLSYTAFGENGEKLSQGKVKMEPLKPGESGVGEIIDLELLNAHRIVIDK